MEEYEKIEMAKRKLKEERLEEVLSGKLPESAITKVRIVTFKVMVCSLDLSHVHSGHRMIVMTVKMKRLMRMTQNSRRL